MGSGITRVENSVPVDSGDGHGLHARTLAIVNADDYGLTPGVNRAIEQAHLAGFVTSTTVMVNGDAAGEVSELPSVSVSLSIGLHVNLTLGQPTTDASRVPTLVGADGCFHSRASLVSLLVRRKVSLQDVTRETSSQIEALRHLGIAPTHWDTHQHVAELPQIARAIGAAARNAGILRARTPRVWFVDSGNAPLAARWRWRISHPRRLAGEASRALSHRVVARSFRTPDFRVATNLVSSQSATYAERWRILLAHLPAGVCEVTTHPGYVDARLAKVTPKLTAERAADLEVAQNVDTPSLLAAARVELIPFTRL